MSRFGLAKWSATSEIFAMGLAGMVAAAMEDPITVTSEELLIARSLSLPPSVFSSSTESLVTFILILLVLLRNLTVHLYIISCMILWWPLFLEEHPALVLPWLVVSGVRNILADVIALLTGTGLCVTFGCLSVTCVEFLVIKGVTMAWSVYLYASVLTFHLDLRRAVIQRRPPSPVPFSPLSRPSDPESCPTEDKRLEMAVRRRMCRSMADEHELRRRLMEAMAADGDEIRKALSTEEVLEQSNVKGTPRLRSLDTLLDRIETDWDQMSYLIERREDEKYCHTLESKAKAFLLLSTNDISSAITHSRHRRRAQQCDQFVQTDMLDMSHMKYVTSTPPIRQLRTLHPVSSWHLQEEAARQLLGPSAYSFQRRSLSNAALLACFPSAPSHKLHSIVSTRLQTINRPALLHFRDPMHLTSLECMSNKRGRRDVAPLSYIVMPPRFGYQHACTQANRLTVNYIQQQIIDAATHKEDELYGKIVWNESDEKMMSSDSLWTRYGSINSEMFRRSEEAKRLRESWAPWGPKALTPCAGAAAQANLDARQSLAAIKKVREVLDHSVFTQTHTDISQSLCEVERRRGARQRAPAPVDARPASAPVTRNARIQADLDHEEALAALRVSSRALLARADAAADAAAKAAAAEFRARAEDVHRQVVDYLKTSEELVPESAITPPEVTPSGSWNSDKGTLPDVAVTDRLWRGASLDEELEDEYVRGMASHRPLGTDEQVPRDVDDFADETDASLSGGVDSEDDSLDVVEYALDFLMDCVARCAKFEKVPDVAATERPRFRGERPRVPVPHDVSLVEELEDEYEREMANRRQLRTDEPVPHDVDDVADETHAGPSGGVDSDDDTLDVVEYVLDALMDGVAMSTDYDELSSDSE